MTKTTIYSPTRIAFWQHHADGDLTVFPNAADGVPFQIWRVFTIAGVSPNGTRADHAHRRCSQLLACLSGKVSVKITDAASSVVEHLEANGICLLIPPMLWNSVTFEGPETVLAVFCDELYDQSDYIREWDEYSSLKLGGA